MSQLMSGAFGGGIGSGVGGILGSLFGSSPTNGTTIGNGYGVNQGDTGSSSNATSNSTSGSSPNLPDWYNKYLQGLVPQYNQLSYQSSQPAIGQPQISQYIQGVNKQTGDATQTAMSQLAKAGALNSGRAAQAITDLQLGKVNNISQYLAQVPSINQNQTFNQGAQLLNSGFNFKAPYGTNYSNWNNGWNNGWTNNYSMNTNTSSQKQHSGGSGLLGLF